MKAKTHAQLSPPTRHIKGVTFCGRTILEPDFKGWLPAWLSVVPRERVVAEAPTCKRCAATLTRVQAS